VERGRHPVSHFDYVEIGAGDFDTILQRADRLNLRGITVEPVRYYLDRLPNVEGCRKVRAAVGKASGEAIIHFVDPRVMADCEQLPDWLRGCSRIGEPHPLALEQLAAVGLDAKAIVREPVRRLSFAKLAAEEGIDSVELLKVDAEGMDMEIVESWLHAATRRPGLLARVVIAETNSFNRKRDLRFLRLRSKMESLGYLTCLGDGQNVIWRKSGR
jgi:hypothetical protein